MVLFIFFNGGDMSKDAWITHPFENIQTDFVDKINGLGNIFMYNPIFYNFHQYNTKARGQTNRYKWDKGYIFEMKDLDLEEHARWVYEKVRDKDDKYILIAHSRGVLYAMKFAEMYGNRVKGIFIIDGMVFSEEFRDWYFEKWRNVFDDMDNKKIRDFLEKIKDKYENNEDNSKDVKFLSQFVKYMTFKQYEILYKKFPTPTTMFVNYDTYNEELNKSKKRWYNRLEKINGPRLKVIDFENKGHFLYFKEGNTIYDVIKKFVGLKGGSIYRHKYHKYKSKYLILKNSSTK